MNEYPRNGPMLLPRESVPFNKLPYPVYVSEKLDGTCAFTYSGQLFSRQLKPIRNQNIYKMLESFLKDYKDWVFHGELYAPNFTETAGVVRSFNKQLPTGFRFAIFDALRRKEFEATSGPDFDTRYRRLCSLCLGDTYRIVEVVNQAWCENAEEVYTKYKHILGRGGEGVVIANPKGYYRTGRAKTKPFTKYRYKPVERESAVIIEVIEQRQMRDDVERGRDLSGHLKKVHTKDSYRGSGMVGSFKVRTEDGREFSCGMGPGCDVSWRRRAYAAGTSLIGRRVIFEYCPVGIKDLPRHPKFLGFVDKDGNLSLTEGLCQVLRTNKVETT